MANKAKLFLEDVTLNARDMAPVLIVVVAFQYLIIQEPFTAVGRLLGGALLVLIGLTLFIRGMTMSLFPLGESQIGLLVRRANIWLLLAFAFAIGFGSTVAEPALITVTEQAAKAAYGADGKEVAQARGTLLRLYCSVAIGCAFMVGCLFIIKGWRIAYLVLGGYALAALTIVTTETTMAAAAFDAGAASTSAINIPLISASAIGLATMIRGRSPLADGFGVVAWCSIVPVLAVLAGTLLGP